MTSPFSEKFDYIFTGTGCAALSLVMRMIQSGKFEDKKILLLDKEAKEKNDRTWCFWEKETNFFEEIVYSQWPALHFYSDTYSSLLDIAPYNYKMIRGVDFYRYCFNEIRKHPNISIAYGSLRFDNDVLFFNDEPARTDDAVIFNSIYKLSENDGSVIDLKQHFKGWVIETNEPSFNASSAILMDFRVHQDHGTTFAYLLPFNDRKALVEYTLFTENLLTEKQYDDALRDYVNNVLGLKEYKITEEEFGVIPMTSRRFSFFENGHYNIGTAGGQTKASSGYTFRFIQKHSDEILRQLLAGKPLSKLAVPSKRFHFYDTILLRLLKENKLKGKDIFARLFERNEASQVFKFLDNETSLAEELRIISSLQTMPFLKAALKR